MSADLLTFPGVRIERRERKVTVELTLQDWVRLGEVAAPLGISQDDMAGRIIRAALKRGKA